ncbi:MULTISPECIES: hypothetical protein [unclassified Sphaerospermopsis]|uniref:hypothetical protein n=1 Tax=unclassified Sphaerospermopsis TaxID=2646443 RepID=UPI00168065A4|nr:MULTISPECIES: hypothetical protein [unclassified Sphaerospermopsis]MBD2134273.1 hypothetical protein [Sphaerospermopsis sp. FACHB-1094]MBD2146453.1 hypothetical protein [Sphaerospermopsis sp. FACHB-1194]
MKVKIAKTFPPPSKTQPQGFSAHFLIKFITQSPVPSDALSLSKCPQSPVPSPQSPAMH